MSGSWSHFDHGADIGIEGRGRTLEEAFEEAALALTAVGVSPDAVPAERQMGFSCSAPDRELLLVDWLNEVIYAMSTEGLLFGRYEVRISDDTLTARGWGAEVARVSERPAVEVKGATMTGLQVRREGRQWIARCVVDV
ncbi:archease [Ectothiorhodospiraceae bacterium WFHF3C12]|nr:archease [Ectothiorhodospiraceae bacterium WFHF3C12]